jgi:hypothetical protein
MRWYTPTVRQGVAEQIGPLTWGRIGLARLCAGSEGRATKAKRGDAMAGGIGFRSRIRLWQYQG